MKKSLIAASFIAGAGLLSTTAYGFVSTPILFDIDGSGGNPAVLIDLFDWSPDNAISVNSIGVQDGSSKQLLAQASLQAFSYTPPGGSKINYLPTSGTEFTFQLEVWEFASGIGTGSAAFTLDPSKPTSFEIFYDTTKDAAPLPGTGYGDGISILSGTIVGLTGTFQSFTDLLIAAFPPVNFDQSGTNNYPNVITDQGNGSTTVDIDVSTYDSNFFKSNIKSLAVDINLTTNAALPFIQVDPSASVVGHTANLGTAITGGTYDGKIWNGLDTCGTTASDNCDFQFQTDASNSFQTVPEPGSLALLGVGLSMVGWVSRRRKLA
jgi:hypothetical protein